MMHLIDPQATQNMTEKSVSCMVSEGIEIFPRRAVLEEAPQLVHRGNAIPYEV